MKRFFIRSEIMQGKYISIRVIVLKDLMSILLTRHHWIKKTTNNKMLIIKKLINNVEDLAWKK